jgi:hypothetical protein
VSSHINWKVELRHAKRPTIYLVYALLLVLVFSRKIEKNSLDETRFVASRDMHTKRSAEVRSATFVNLDNDEVNSPSEYANQH